MLTVIAAVSRLASSVQVALRLAAGARKPIIVGKSCERGSRVKVLTVAREETDSSCLLTVDGARSVLAGGSVAAGN